MRSPKRRFAVLLLVASLPLASPLWAGNGNCAGDCNGDSEVSVDELVIGTQLALSGGSLGCPAIDIDMNGSVSIDELVVAVRHALEGCPMLPTPTPVGLGTRRFSIDPKSSPLLAVLREGEVASSLPGFAGFLSLRAGEPDPETGVAFVDVTDASEFLSIEVPEQGVALCIRPIRERLPVVHAGIVACSGGVTAGLRVAQNHRLGELGHCSAGTECSVDDDCTSGSCFSMEDCEAAGGRVEGPSDPHPGVCNGPLRGGPFSVDSGVGAVLILPDPVGNVTRGLPVEIFNETALPCGDEGVSGMETEIALTSGIVEVEVENANNQPSETLSHQVSGENFSCVSWEDENGPGRLVLGLPGLDVPAVNDQLLDVLTFFVWED